MADRRRYDRDYGRPGGEFRNAPPGFWGGGPVWGGGPSFGFGGWGPYESYGWRDYWSEDRTPRRPPEESPTYGRGGDRAVRRWAQNHGYDAGYAIKPRGERGGGRSSRRSGGHGREFRARNRGPRGYDRDYGGGRRRGGYDRAYRGGRGRRGRPGRNRRYDRDYGGDANANRAYSTWR